MVGGERPFRSTLDLIHIDHTFVGEYHCIQNDSMGEIENLEELQMSFKASKIYVFVDGTHAIPRIVGL